LASAAPRSPYRHLELCGIALTIFERFTAPRSTTMIHYYLFFVSKTPVLTL